MAKSSEKTEKRARADAPEEESASSKRRRAAAPPLDQGKLDAAFGALVRTMKHTGGAPDDKAMGEIREKLGTNAEMFRHDLAGSTAGSRAALMRTIGAVIQNHALCEAARPLFGEPPEDICAMVKTMLAPVSSSIADPVAPAVVKNLGLVLTIGKLFAGQAIVMRMRARCNLFRLTEPHQHLVVGLVMLKILAGPLRRAALEVEHIRDEQTIAGLHDSAEHRAALVRAATGEDSESESDSDEPVLVPMDSETYGLLRQYSRDVMHDARETGEPLLATALRVETQEHELREVAN